jgi:hypothetical protein
MRKFYLISLIGLAFGCAQIPKDMGPEFQKYDGYYFFHNQLKRIESEKITNKDSIWFGRLDVKNSRLQLIDVTTWNEVNALELELFKGNVFYLKGIENMFLSLEPSASDTGQHSLAFVRDKNDTERSLGSGYYVHELKSIDDCKKFLHNWKEDLKKTDCDKESCYGN